MTLSEIADFVLRTVAIMRCPQKGADRLTQCGKADTTQSNMDLIGSAKNERRRGETGILAEYAVIAQAALLFLMCTISHPLEFLKVTGKAPIN